MRGIGQSDFYPQVDPGVGIYLDGVYISRTTGAVLDAVDIGQIEVLRGPQGTLYGKNTIGGAINITSRRPDNRSEEHTSELQSLMRISYAVFCLTKKNKTTTTPQTT